MKRMQSTPPVTRMGTVGNRFNASTLEFTVARREANGTLSTTCVTGDDAAVTAMHGETKGERHDH